jgi:uracil-DNA glycosylase family 4
MAKTRKGATTALEALQEQITGCQRCPRLRQHCLEVARVKKREFRDWDYWGKPVPGFGDPKARVWIVGLAPAAHGANRTGRMFTGDKSGEWLYRALHENGFANQPQSISTQDGMALDDVYISAAARCAPPDNKPTPQELANCEGYLQEEAKLLKNVQVILVLGKIAWDTVYRAFAKNQSGQGKKADFKHGGKSEIGLWKVQMSYHPSRQNTNTGRLTREMWDGIFKSVQQQLRN